jgi:putative transposase
MRSRYRVVEAYAPHFVTSTVVSWLPVFTTAARCNILVESLEYCRKHKGLRVYAWVILDNHYHAVVTAPELVRVMADLKRHTTKAMIEQLEKESCGWLLHELKFHRAGYKAESERQFWQEGFHPQALTGDVEIDQRLDYVHNNPVVRGLVAAPEHWRYSSAHEWLTGAVPVMRCDRWEETTA